MSFWNRFYDTRKWLNIGGGSYLTRSHEKTIEKSADIWSFVCAAAFYREGDRYTTLEQLQLTLSLESSAKEPVEEAERPASSSVRFDCTCFLLPCSSADRCLSAKNKSPGPKNTHELPTLHAALAGKKRFKLAIAN